MISSHQPAISPSKAEGAVTWKYPIMKLHDICVLTPAAAWNTTRQFVSPIQFALKSKFSLDLLLALHSTIQLASNFSSIWQSNTTNRYLLYPAIFLTCSFDAQSLLASIERTPFSTDFSSDAHSHSSRRKTKIQLQTPLPTSLYSFLHGRWR